MHPIAVKLAPAGDPMAQTHVVRELAERYLIWDAFVSGARRVDVHPLVLSPALHQSAVYAAESVVRVLQDDVVSEAFASDDERLEYGFHPDTLKLVDASRAGGEREAMVRVDLLLDRSLRWRVCEVNADCPGGHNESVALPRLSRSAGGYLAGTNPTFVVDALAQRLAALVRQAKVSDGAVALLYATAYSEDLQVCAFLKRALERLGVKAILCPATMPKIKNGVLTVRGQPVTVLYRYFPTEYMEGQRNLDDIAACLADGRVHSVSSFNQMFLQSKLVLARAWNQVERAKGQTRAVIQAHIPESYDVADVSMQTLLRDRAAWVIKRTLGRVGDDVFVGQIMEDDAWHDIVELVATLRAAGDRWIAQRYVDQHPVPTPWGEQLVTLGAYVLNGRFAGYYARITPESHVSHDALCVPVFTERAA